MKKTTTKILLVLAILIKQDLLAQVKVGNNPTTIQSNSLLELESTNKGLLLPRLTLSATNNVSPLTAHVAGMVVYNTATAGTAPNNVTPGYYYNDGAKWVRVATFDEGSKWTNNNSSGRVELTNLSNGTTARTAGTELVITDAGNMGVGTVLPQAKFNVLGQIRSSGIGPNVGQIALSRLNGTESSPTAVLNAQLLGSILFNGYNGTGFVNTASINGRATENYSSSASGSHIGFNTTTNGTTTVSERMRIDQNGNIGFGTTGPRALLHANREINAVAQTTGGTSASAQYNTQLHLHNPTQTIGEGSGISFGNGGLGLVAGKIVAIRSNGFVDGHLAFFTKGANANPTNLDETIERMRITDIGNVGIGTVSPSYSLDVNGTARIATTPTITTASRVLVKDPSTGQVSEQLISTMTGATNAKIIYTGTTPTSTGALSTSQIITIGNFEFTIVSNGTSPVLQMRMNVNPGTTITATTKSWGWLNSTGFGAASATNSFTSANFNTWQSVIPPANGSAHFFFIRNTYDGSFYRLSYYAEINQFTYLVAELF
ncbi:MAG: hypothetical protein Q8K70_07930 [Bacteroidota bacterium]|nr:hypothetical protein [Bacteroidota bacterium]